MIISLPVPPSTNSLYRNAPGRGRVPTGNYQRWREEAEDRFWGLRYKTFEEPVAVTLTLPERCGLDVDNGCKASLDFIVRMRVIHDDSKKYVRRLVVEFADVAELIVEVIPYVKVDRTQHHTMPEPVERGLLGVADSPCPG